MQSSLWQIPNGMQGMMRALEQNTLLTGQTGARVVALVSHVNVGNAGSGTFLPHGASRALRAAGRHRGSRQSIRQ